MGFLCALAALGLATASHAAAESNLDILEPIGKGPTRPFRAVTTAISKASGCNINFGQVPNNTILIIETVSCASKPLNDPEKDGASVTVNGQRFVGFVPPSANPNIKLLTSAYLPFRAGEGPAVALGGQSETSGVCNLTGRLLPVD